MAEDYLKKKGYKILERNYRCPLGELDLVVVDGKVVVFVEVKVRTEHLFGAPLEAVDWRKKKKMVNAPLYFLSHYRLHQRDARFDVIGISKSARGPVMGHVNNAFHLDETS